MLRDIIVERERRGVVIRYAKFFVCSFSLRICHLRKCVCLRPTMCIWRPVAIFNWRQPKLRSIFGHFSRGGYVALEEKHTLLNRIYAHPCSSFRASGPRFGERPAVRPSPKRRQREPIFFLSAPHNNNNTTTMSPIIVVAINGTSAEATPLLTPP